MRQAQPRGESSRRNMPAPNTQYTTKTRPQSARGRPIPGQAPAAKRDPILQGVRPAGAALAVGAIFPHQQGSETRIFRAPPQAQTGSRWARPSARRGLSRQAGAARCANRPEPSIGALGKTIPGVASANGSKNQEINEQKNDGIKKSGIKKSKAQWAKRGDKKRRGLGKR